MGRTTDSRIKEWFVQHARGRRVGVVACLLHSIDDGSEGTLSLVLLLSCIEAVGNGKCYSWHHPLRGGQLCVLSYQPYFHRCKGEVVE